LEGRLQIPPEAEARCPGSPDMNQLEVVGLGFQSWKKHANVTLPVLFKTVLLRILPIE